MITLRAVEPDDIDLLYNWENDTDNWKVSNTITPFSKYYLEQYILNTQNDIYTEKQLRLMIELKESNKLHIIGSVDLFEFDPVNKKAGIGILISKEFRNKGFATKVLNILIDYCFKTLDLHQLFCNILEDNNESVKLFANSGFEIVGLKKDWIKYENKWLNEYLLQLINPLNK